MISSEIMNSSQRETRKTVACLACKLGHRKCCGTRPCFNCTMRKVECVENQKRKPVGRPKIKNTFEKRIKNNKFIECKQCKAKISFESKFCNYCGFRLEESLEMKNIKLKEEINQLKKKIVEMVAIIELGKFSGGDMWIVMKIAPINEGKKTCPMPSHILEVSSSLLKLLGYDNLTNYYYPDLIPLKHHKVIDKENNTFTAEKVNGQIANCKMSFEDSLYLRHSNNHYVQVFSKVSTYIDHCSKSPTICTVHISDICNFKVEENSVPSKSDTLHGTFYVDNFDELPSILQKVVSSSVPGDILRQNIENPSYLSFNNDFLLPIDDSSKNDPFFDSFQNVNDSFL
eukprot:TRINITY_DN1544_c0_g1_i2.p1 TRINITY_DN1544_c0_g1~~TRINITY_DN1544_c0_g1_i2.p1  ORF type:complete len:343 (-),score=55.89 TRINITY_DN1544_c0_g1_i2:44-1072(-)